MKVSFSQVDRNIICDLAQKTLWQEKTDDTQQAYAYLHEKRGVADDVLKLFNFGYYPARLRSQGHDWAGRIIMPLIDQNQDLIVLTSRDFRCTDKGKMPHLHEVFDKKLFLYGMNVAKQNIVKKQKAIVVEGQFDTVCSHTFGFDYTVGILGSAFSIQHCIVLSRYCRDIYLVYDNDISGCKNLERSIAMYKSYGLEANDIRFIPIVLPLHKDPDEFLHKEGKSYYAEILDSAKNEVEKCGTIEYFNSKLSGKLKK
jgi:DNA primase